MKTEQLPEIISEIDQQVARFKADYSNIVVVDSESLTGAKTAYQTLVKFRTGTDKRRKDLIAPALDWQRKVNAEFDRIVSETKPIEQALSNSINAFEKAEEERKRKKESERIKDLQLYGCVLTGSMWVYARKSILATEVLSMSDEAFDKLKIEIVREVADFNEQKRKEKEIEAQLEAKRKELAELEEKLRKANEQKAQPVVVTTVEIINTDEPFNLFGDEEQKQEEPIDERKKAYNAGVRDCKTKVIELLNDRSITSRQVLISKIEAI